MNSSDSRWPRPTQFLLANALFLLVLALFFAPSLLVKGVAASPAIKIALEAQLRDGFAKIALCGGLGWLAFSVARYGRALGQVAENCAQTLAAAQKTAHFSAQAGATERYGRAMALLGSESVEVRLGGIYTLERLARESSDDHGPIIEVLAAFGREHGAWREGETLPARPGADLQAMATVVARRHVAFDAPDFHLDLHGTGLARIYWPWAQLESAFLYESNFDGAILQNANLRGAWLWKSSFHDAILDGAHLEGADLTAASGLCAAQLQNAHWDEKTKFPGYVRAELEGGPKSEAEPENADKSEDAENLRLPTLRLA